MRSWFFLVILAWLVAEPAVARPATVTLWQMDCGSFPAQELSDGCYLIRHNDTYMIWDMGLGTELLNQPPQMVHGHVVTMRATLEQQLALLGLKPDDISKIALSHKHFDHIAQAAVFPHATLLIGKEDWDDLVNHPSDLSERLQPWIKNGAPKQLVQGDKDIFGDGTVVMLDTPGHTKGHHSLLVRLHHQGSILLTGDLYSSAKQMESQSVPAGNVDPQATRASYRRFNDLAAKLHATIIVSHSQADIAKLPTFPKAAT